MRGTRMVRLWSVLLLLGGLLSGCLEYHERIRVRDDGRVEIQVYAVVANAAFPMLKNRPELRQLLLLPTSRAAARRRLPKGIDVAYWYVEQEGGTTIYDVAVTFPSVSDIEAHLGGLLPGQSFSLILDTDGRYRYRREVPPEPFALSGGPVAAFVRKRLAASTLEFTLEVPTRIVETNGERLSERAVRWRTNLVELRERGLVMEAAIEPPTLWTRHPWLGAVLIAVVGIALSAAWIRVRRRGRA